MSGIAEGDDGRRKQAKEEGMKKNLALARTLFMSLLTTVSITPAPVIAIEQKRPLSPQKQSLLRRLVADYKETKKLRAKRKAGKATPQELEKLDERMRKIKKQAIAAGVIAAFIAALVAGSTWAAHRKSTASPFPLHQAVRSYDINKIEALVKAGADINKWNYNNETPLHHAVKRNLQTVATKLLEMGANPNIKDPRYGQTALYVAADLINEAMVELLLKHGADPFVKDKYGHTPFVIANRSIESRLSPVEIAVMPTERLQESKEKKERIEKLLREAMHERRMEALALGLAQQAEEIETETGLVTDPRLMKFILQQVEEQQ